jgi:hypothetical protein
MPQQQQEEEFPPGSREAPPGSRPAPSRTTAPTTGVRPGNITPPVFGPTIPPSLTRPHTALEQYVAGTAGPRKREEPFGTKAWNFLMKEPLDQYALANYFKNLPPEEQENIRRQYGLGAGAYETLDRLTIPLDAAITALSGGRGKLAEWGMNPSFLEGLGKGLNWGMTGRGMQNLYEGAKEGKPGQAAIGGVEAILGARGLGVGGQLKKGFDWIFPGTSKVAGGPMKGLGNYPGTESGMHPTPENLKRASEVLWKYGDDPAKIKTMTPEQIIDAAVATHPDEFMHAPVSNVLVNPENYKKALDVIKSVVRGPINLEGKSPGDIIDIAAGMKPQAFEGVVTFPQKGVPPAPGPIETPPNIQRIRSRASIGTEEFLSDQPITAFGKPIKFNPPAPQIIKGPVIKPTGAIAPEYQLPKEYTSGYTPKQPPPPPTPPTGGGAPPPVPGTDPPKDPEMLKRFTMEVFNYFRAMKASGDMSPVIRQGGPLSLTKAWRQSLMPMIRAWGDKRAADRIKAEILSHPNFQPRRLADGSLEPSFAERSGLSLTSSDKLTTREEILMSTWAPKTPIVGKTIVAPSNRAYETFLNTLRALHFNNLVERAVKAGRDPYGTDLGKGIAEFVNITTGRGSLGKLEKVAAELNSALFAPRLLMRNIQMPWKMISPSTDPFLRKEYIKANLNTVANWLGFTSLIKLAGDQFGHPVQVSWDSTNPDFGKAKIGNTRMDLGAGYLQWAVAISRLAQNKYTSSETGETKSLSSNDPTAQDQASIIGNFFRNKLNVPVKLFVDSLMKSQRRYMNFSAGVTKGGPLDLMENTAIQTVLPMFSEDMYEVWKEDPDLYQFLGIAIPSFFGGATQTYGGERTERFK